MVMDEFKNWIMGMSRDNAQKYVRLALPERSCPPATHSKFYVPYQPIKAVFPRLVPDEWKGRESSNHAR